MGRVAVGPYDYKPMPIVGYADRVSVRPGEDIRFHVSLEGGDEYRAELVRLTCADLSAEGPGVKEKVVESPINGLYRGEYQETRPGSYGLVPHSPLLDGPEGLSIAAFVCPMTPDAGLQAIAAKWSMENQAGYGLFIDENGCPSFWVGDGSVVSRVATDVPLRRGIWYFVGATYDPSGSISIVQRAWVNSYNSRLGRIGIPGDDDARSTSPADTRPESSSPIPFMIAACVDSVDDAGSAIATAHYTGKIEDVRITAHPVGVEALPSIGDDPSVPLATAWDFAVGMTKQGFVSPDPMVDTSANRLHGRFVNLPTRGVTGHRWVGEEYRFIHAPDEYAAVHFHADDLEEAGWDVAFELTMPNDVPSGFYAVRLRAVVEGFEEEDYAPFFVLPPRGEATASVALLAPTATYLAYANDNMAADDVSAVVLENTIGSAPIMGKEDLARQVHREYGGSTYDTHIDGSGVMFSSWRRPILNVRPKYRHTLSHVWQYNADLHLVDWLSEKGFAFDVITDHDLHSEGVALLSNYRVVLSGTHPEYCSAAMLDGIETYLERGGRFMYLGGNGYYWVTAFHPDGKGTIEVRKWGGTEAWTTAPGERYLSFTGELGGLWRNRGRAPQKLVGVGFIAQGLDVATYYRRRVDGYEPDVAWIFEGVENDQRIGDYGLEGGGAAGMEIDAYDPALGSPGHASLVAASEGHTSLMLEVRENFGITQPNLGGTTNPRVRADIVYFATPHGGGVFSTGSISWCGSLSHGQYDNDVSRITENVLRRFLDNVPLS